MCANKFWNTSNLIECEKYNLVSNFKKENGISFNKTTKSVLYNVGDRIPFSVLCSLLSLHAANL
jgi:hypothetical protein